MSLTIKRGRDPLTKLMIDILTGSNGFDLDTLFRTLIGDRFAGQINVGQIASA
jgi:hypothetical protein